MHDSRSRFVQWTDCLLDSSRRPGEQRAAAHEWCQWALKALGIDERRAETEQEAFSRTTRLPNGQAISPLEAVRCLRDYQRAAVFLRATDAAIRAARGRFPGETIHVLEAGCGPLAPLALAAAVRYPAAEVSFTLLDLHGESLEGARRLAGELGVLASLRAPVAADAGTVQFSEPERPHVIVCEMLQRALTMEPQVAVTRHLVTQLRPGGFFLPERIDIVAGLVHRRRRRQRMMGITGGDGADPIEELGCVFSLDAATAASLTVRPDGRLAATNVTIPVHDHEAAPLRLLTRIQVFRDHRIGDFDSAITLPEQVRYPLDLAEAGGVASFTYEMSENPGLRLESIHPNERQGTGIARNSAPLPASGA